MARDSNWLLVGVGRGTFHPQAFVAKQDPIALPAVAYRLPPTIEFQRPATMAGGFRRQ